MACLGMRWPQRTGWGWCSYSMRWPPGEEARWNLPPPPWECGTLGSPTNLLFIGFIPMALLQLALYMPFCIKAAGNQGCDLSPQLHTVTMIPISALALPTAFALAMHPGPGCGWKQPPEGFSPPAASAP